MSSSLQFADQVALVTGASSGIGRATALALAHQGAAVALVARRQSELEAVAEAIKVTPGKALVIPADVTLGEDRQRVIDITTEAFQGLDVLVNAAGVIRSGNIENTSLDAWQAMFDLNVTAVFHLMQLAVPFLEESQGNIVNISSVTGIRSFPGVLSYCTSKAAVDQLTRCSALELAAKGIRVNAINPGVVVTALHREGGFSEEKYANFLEHSKTTHPMERVGTPEEVADLILFLASKTAGWITGVTMPIDGGRHLTCAR